MSGASRRRTSSRRQRRRSGGSLHHSGLSGGVAASVFEVGSSSGVGDAVDDENAFGVDVDVVRLEADVRWEQVDVAALGSDVVGAMADFVEEQADAMGVQLFHSASPSQLGLPSIAAARYDSGFLGVQPNISTHYGQFHFSPSAPVMNKSDPSSDDGSNGDSEDPDLQSTSEDSGDNQEDVEDSKDFKFVYQDEAWNQTFLTYVLGHLGFIGISSSNVHWRRAYQPRRNVCAIPARKISFNRALYYIVCQCLGVICDLGIVKGFQPDFYQAVGGGTNSVAHGYTKGDGLGAEIIDTFVLVYVVFATTNKKHKARDSHVPALVPLPIEFAVYLVHLATIPIIGTIINLARSLGLAIIFNTQHNSYADHELELIRHTAKVQV